MAVSHDFLEYVLDQLEAWNDVSVRKMFGCAGLYRDGKMFGVVADDVAFLKVDETNKEKYIQSGSAPFKPFPNGKVMLSFFEVPAEILEDQEALITWADESLSIQKKGK